VRWRINGFHSVTFAPAGGPSLICLIHPFMTATVTVGA
jgi:hypothetical protein